MWTKPTAICSADMQTRDVITCRSTMFRSTPRQIWVFETCKRRTARIQARVGTRRDRSPTIETV